MNHFYDPVNNQGLVDSILGKWQESKKWANDEKNQNSLTYKVPATIASILTVLEQGKISAFSTDTDFVWNKAIEYWNNGEKEKAMFALGHVLHLIQDASVPDHTRNDPHAEGSPYEKWADKFNLGNPDFDIWPRLDNKKPVLLNDLDNYFDGLAIYSNNNFYSKDTIGIQSGYKSPEPDYFDIGNDGKKYGMKNDREFGDYPLLKSPPKLLVVSLNNEEFFKSNLVLSNYWSRLSTKSVQYGAGVINLFFKEAEKAKNNQNFSKEESKSFFASLIDVVRNLFSDKNEKLAAEIALDKPDIDNKNRNEKIENNKETIKDEEKVVLTPKNNFIDEQDEDAIEAANRKKIEEDPVLSANMVQAVPAQPKQIKSCAYATDKIPIHQKLIINEVAWMGGPASANDEWIELKNISGVELDVFGWQILDKDENIKITFSEKTKLPVSGFLLLERTDDNSVPGATADIIYSGVLLNTNEGLRLYDNECNLIDEVAANSDWPAGISEARRTMERQPDFSWNTYSGSGENFGGINIMGTPKKENSPLIISGGAPSAPAANSQQNAAQTNSPAPSTSSGQVKILISEIQITGGAGKSNNDFIELYNPNDFQVNLNGYRLVKRAKTGTTDISIKSWISDAFIPAKGYYLWANNDYIDISMAPDITTSAILADDNGVVIRFGVENTGTVIDSVGWGAAQNNFVETQAFSENPIANQSISRQSENDTNNNSVDFIKSKLSPKNSSVSGGFLVSEAWASSVQAVSHIVISEIYPDRTGANNDFIELYNPNAPGSSDTDISGWSLQVLSANATSTSKISKKNFEAGNKIPASGFFLVGIDDYPAADMNWVSGSLNSTDGATIFLVNGTSTITSFEDSRIIDRIAYGSGSGIMSPEISASPLPESGKSLERKSLQNGICVSPQNSGEFLGNGCDMDNNAEDLELRTAPNPQGLKNLLEPRSAPAAPQNFSAQYNQAAVSINLNWNESPDYSGATSSMKYLIKYATSTAAEPKEFAELSATTTYSFITNEVGVTDRFLIYVKDKDGLMSDAASATLEIPSFLTNVFLYPDPRSASTTALELRYASYPYIPSPYWSGGSWKVIIFYKNQDAPALPYFYSDTQYATTPDGFYPKQYGEWGSAIAGAWKLKYSTCSFSVVSDRGTALILPDSGGFCSNAFGGIRNSAFDFSKLEDFNLIIGLGGNQPDSVAGDYATVGFYSYGGNNNQRLVAVDRTKYYFQNSVPNHQPPQFNGELNINFNKDRSELVTSWQRATDADTIDSSIVYEINYSTSTQFESGNWKLTRWSIEERKQVSPGDRFLIGVRAKDDFGNYSEIKTIEWSYPETTFLIQQNQANSWSSWFGSKNPNCPSCPDTASLQSIQPAENLQFNIVTLKLKQDLASDNADIRLGVYPNNNNLPDFNSKIAEAKLTGLFSPDFNSGIAFTFDNPVSLLAGNIYWLVLDIEKHSDSRGWFRNQWQNAINAGSDLYAAGFAGIGNSGLCDSWCDFYIPYPNASADWYFKIGMFQ